MKVLVFPRADKNPYQELLYNALANKYDVQVDYLKNNRSTFILFPAILLFKWLRGYRIFHLHWPSFYVAKTYPRADLISYLLSMYCLGAVRFSSLKLVWTIHNAVPHEAQTINDLGVAKYIAKHSAAKIIHSGFVKNELKHLGLETTNTFVIPHGNYSGVYPDAITSAKARKKLNIGQDEFVILFFGLIRAYKGVDDLLEAFASLKKSNTRLLIVGKIEDADLERQITNSLARMNVSFYPGYVDDSDVAMYFKASDVVCLPFKAITTSGSALLALTFARPIIAPRTGALLDMPGGVGLFYDPTDSRGLLKCLEKTAKDQTGQSKRVKAAHAYAETLSWDNIADATYRLYISALKKVDI